MEPNFLLLLGAAVVLGMIPGTIAFNKGRDFFLWWLYGAVLFIVALPHALLVSHEEKSLEAKQLSNGMRKCPSCAELIKREAVVCRFCQRNLPPVETLEVSHADQAVVKLKLMDQHGITFDGAHYYRAEKRYKSFTEALPLS